MVMKGNLSSILLRQISFAYENTIENVNIEIDNKNPLYNAYITVDSIKNDKYKIADFNLINVTLNDTLFVRSEFKRRSKK